MLNRPIYLVGLFNQEMNPFISGIISWMNVFSSSFFHFCFAWTLFIEILGLQLRSSDFLNFFLLLPINVSFLVYFIRSFPNLSFQSIYWVSISAINFIFPKVLFCYLRSCTDAFLYVSENINNFSSWFPCFLEAPLFLIYLTYYSPWGCKE